MSIYDDWLAGESIKSSSLCCETSGLRRACGMRALQDKLLTSPRFDRPNALIGNHHHRRADPGRTKRAMPEI